MLVCRQRSQDRGFIRTFLGRRFLRIRCFLHLFLRIRFLVILFLFNSISSIWRINQMTDLSIKSANRHTHSLCSSSHPPTMWRHGHLVNSTCFNKLHLNGQEQPMGHSVPRLMCMYTSRGAQIHFFSTPFP